MDGAPRPPYAQFFGCLLCSGPSDLAGPAALKKNRATNQSPAFLKQRPQRQRLHHHRLSFRRSKFRIPPPHPNSTTPPHTSRPLNFNAHTKPNDRKRSDSDSGRRSKALGLSRRGLTQASASGPERASERPRASKRASEAGPRHGGALTRARTPAPARTPLPALPGGELHAVALHGPAPNVPRWT